MSTEHPYCVVCTNTFDYTLIESNEYLKDSNNNPNKQVRICKPETCWNQPTCLEVYTEKYFCNICHKQQNVNEFKCFMFYHEDFNYMYKYICEECIASTFEVDKQKLNKESTNKWIMITDSDLLTFIQSLYEIYNS